MMHMAHRSRDPPPYHPGWGGLARKLVLERKTPYSSGDRQLPSYQATKLPHRIWRQWAWNIRRALLRVGAQ